MGHLDKGGIFEEADRSCTRSLGNDCPECGHERKALPFKTIDAHEIESHGRFHRISDDITLAEVHDILRRQIVGADIR